MTATSPPFGLSLSDIWDDILEKAYLGDGDTMDDNSPQVVRRSRPAQPALAVGAHDFLAAGLRLAYWVAGQGPVLVVQSPGWGIGAKPYELTFGPLERRFTVVYLTPRGSPGSDSPQHDSDLNVGAMAADLEALRVQLALERFALAGHSHGGLIALHYAAAHPNRVSHLIAINPQVVGNLPPGPPARQAPSVQRDGEFVQAMAYFQKMGGFGYALALDHDREIAAFLGRVMPLYFRRSHFARPLQEWLRTAGISHRPLRATAASDNTFPLRGVLARIEGRVLIVSGEHDIICLPVSARALHHAIRGSELDVFPESGHFPWLEEKENFFRRLITFLADA